LDTNDNEVSILKLYLSVCAAIAALAITSAASVAQQTGPPGNRVNSNVPGSPGYTGAAGPMHSHKKAITKKQAMALNGPHSKTTQTNSKVPGSPGYTGAAQHAGSQGGAGSSTTPQYDATKTKQTNSSVPGSPGYTGAAKPAGT